MPTYTYRCSKCGDEIEVFQSMSDPPLKRCKKCRGALRRTFHPVGIVLKGSGFYKTDYGSSGGKKASASSEDKDKRDTSSSKTDSGSKSDTSKSDSSTGDNSSKGGSSKESKSTSSD